MINKSVIDIAIECGLVSTKDARSVLFQNIFSSIMEFSDIVAAAERESCAKVIEEYFGVGHEEGEDCALVIRQRSQS